MKEGGIGKGMGCSSVLMLPVVLFLAIIPFFMLKTGWLYITEGRFANAIFTFVCTCLLLCAYYGGFVLLRKFMGRDKKTKNAKPRDPNAVQLYTTRGNIVLNNPFRGIFVLGAAGSGKSESVGVPLLGQFIEHNYAGIVYDFKFPTLANDVEAFVKAKSARLRHFYLDFNNPLRSYRVNPLNPKYLPNTSYAREYAQAIVANLLKESIKKPDFWTRSATDLLTACIWYLREERPDICDLPHVFAMITSNDVDLLNLLQTNTQTAQMTMSIYNAMQRKADGQVSGVIGTLQGAIAQLNTPELMYIFSGDDFSLNVNDPQNPIILTVGSYPTLTQTFAPLCSLVITVATKLMNQPAKAPSFVLLDEAPTIFVPNLEVLPNTGRSNKVATVLMCQDLAQLTDGYGREKADVLFASCNTHFYGRVASSVTADILSKQFGKTDKVYTTASEGGKGLQGFIMPHKTKSETVQERDVMKSATFLQMGVGEFAGIAVESNVTQFRRKFLQANRPAAQPLSTPPASRYVSLSDYYQTVRDDIDQLLG